MKRKLALLLILKIPTIKKAVELLNSIGVLKLTAINFKKTNIMKKMLFGLIATVMLSVCGNAQEVTGNQKQLLVNTQVVSLITLSKSVYQKGQTYEDFVKNFTTPSPYNPFEGKLMKVVYSDLASNTSTCEILSRDASELVALGQKHGASNLTAINKTKCGFWCQLVIAIIEAIIETIKP